MARPLPVDAPARIGFESVALSICCRNTVCMSMSKSHIDKTRWIDMAVGGALVQLRDLKVAEHPYV